jgi:signal transduction histidine kinase
LENALRERAEALVEADQLKTEFLTNVSYEFRTPLTSIIGFAEMLDQAYFGDLNPKQREYLSNILSSSQRLLLLISDILDLAVTDAGRLALDVGAVRVPGLMESVVEMVRESASVRGLTIDLEMPETLGAIEGDERRLKQVFFNILSNAIRFTAPGGAIHVKGQSLKDSVRLEVTDTGVGIREDELAQVFERFRKGSNAKQTKGVGVGLALVKQFVELHGGVVKLQSTPMKGTTVAAASPPAKGGRRRRL